MDGLLSAAQWVVGKALAPIADGVLGHWDASKNLGLNVDALGTELLLVKATLETASRKNIGGEAMQELLWKLQESAHCADDLLDELDYFRIHDQLHGTYDAADQHAKGGVHDIALNARHTARAVCAKLLGLSACSSAAAPADPGQVVEDAGHQVGCCAWPRARRSRSRRNSSSAPNENQANGPEVTGCMPKLGKLLPCSYSQNVHHGNSGVQSTLCSTTPKREHEEDTTMLGFNRVDLSERMKHIVEQLQPVRTQFATILQSCDSITVSDIAKSRPITTGQSIEPKLYGRDHIIDSIIHDITGGKYHNTNLTVLPIVGPGGIGKTTLIQHIYRNQQVQNNFQVVVWACVSLSFNLNNLLEDIKKDIPPVQGEKGHRPEELIEQRLKSKRFLLVLDDIWECSNDDDWKRLLLPLKTSQEKGSIILVTTRFPAIAEMVKTTDHIELEGLESEGFRKLFLEFVFGGEPFTIDHDFLLQTGEKIMKKLKGSPLAAKTVGTLLRKDLSLRHWRRVLESKEWERQSGANDIMPALKLSYDYLPFHQQQCFFYSALFPEDHKYSTTDLINLWIGLDILQHGGPNQKLEDIGLSILNDLVTHGFFKEEETYGDVHYVMHDLLHDLAQMVASHECLTVHHSNVRSVEIHPSIRHLSIIIDQSNTLSHENFKSQLRKLMTRLTVTKLHTLILFGKIDESFAVMLGDLFREAKSLRILRLVDMPSSVESILQNFSALIHLRYLCLGHSMDMPLPLAISRFYHLRILDLGSWYHCHDLPKDLSNLAKLRHIYTPSDELHSDIVNVGKLVFLEELKVFRVNKESEGFEPKQLEHLTELRELGIYNLENIYTKEEAAKTKLKEKNYLEKLTLDWDSDRPNIEPVVETVVLETLQPHPYLEELCIRGHRGPSCPTWLGNEITVEALQSLHLDGVSWQCLPFLGRMWSLGKIKLEHIVTMKEFVIEQSFCRLIRLELVGLGNFEKWVPSQSHDAHMFPLLQVLSIRNCPKLLELPFSNHIVYPEKDGGWNIDWFPKLKELEILGCPEFFLVAQIPWKKTLGRVSIIDVKLLEILTYDPVQLQIVGKDLQNLDQILAFSNLTGLKSLILCNCPPLESKHLLMLSSLRRLQVANSDGLLGPLGGEGKVEWQLPVDYLNVSELRGASGKELTELLPHLPRLSQFHIARCENITQLAVGVDVQQTTSEPTAVSAEKEDGLLLFPAHLSNSLQVLKIEGCPELVLMDPPTFLAARRGGGGGGGGGGLQALRSLQILRILGSPKILSAITSLSFYLFPSSLQNLSLQDVEGMGTLEPLSNLTSLTTLDLWGCGENLSCRGLGPLLTTGGQLGQLTVRDSPRFFAGWDTDPRRVLLQRDEGGEEEQLVSVPAICSSRLWRLHTDDAMGLLAAPICSILSSSLLELYLYGTCQGMECFSKEQEDALQLLTSLQQLMFAGFVKLQHLPAGLNKLTNLVWLHVYSCPAIRYLPKDGLPKSLRELNVSSCGNDELKRQFDSWEPSQ